MPKKEPVQFEQWLKELEDLVKHLESGNLPLEEALKQFETGVKLSKQCNDFLHTAEQQIHVLQNGALRSYNNDI